MLDSFITHSPLFYLTQSYWRDEVFSVFVAEHSLPWILATSNLEPPLYYVFLHIWMKIFGNSEIGTRSMSLFFVLCAAIIVVFWSERIIKDKWLQFLLPLAFFFNPMIIYYAFEVRAYGVYIFFAVLSMFAYSEKKWLLYILASVAGFYTHTYFLFLFSAQVFHALITNIKLPLSKSSVRKILQNKSFLAIGITLAAYLPWLYRVYAHSGQLKNSWYYPVDWQLVKSVLGNMFIGYEGTPWFLWQYTFYVSLAILAATYFVLIRKHTRRLGLFFTSVMLIPVILVVGASFIKPLYVNRYIIPVTIAEVFLVYIGFETIRNVNIRRLAGIAVFIGIMVFNTWYPTQHAKAPIRDVIREIVTISTPSDLIYAESPLIFFETVYYSSDRSRVRLYNPDGYAFPWYIGKAVFSDSSMVNDFPTYPNRAFLVKEDMTYSIIYKTVR